MGEGSAEGDGARSSDDCDMVCCSSQISTLQLLSTLLARSLWKMSKTFCFIFFMDIFLSTKRGADEIVTVGVTVGVTAVGVTTSDDVFEVTLSADVVNLSSVLLLLLLLLLLLVSSPW